MTLRRLPWALALLFVLFAVLMGAGAAISPPPVRESAVANQFDTASARARLARILGDEAPHPIDSARQDETRAVLLAEIEALGLKPEVRERFTCRPGPGAPVIDCMMVRNIVFSIGPDDGPAVLAAAHYDSVPAAPGASDAGIGLAAWLEVARVLSQETLTRRVIFLFTDGEEIALIGAHVFAAHDPDMATVQALINLEARGTRGPALFFETNRPNADAIAAFAGAPRGVANSMMADIYEILPNDTDVTEFRRDGLDIINIALLDGLEHYHTPQDSLASQDMRSLQHMGDIALHVTRKLASAPDRGADEDVVFTDLASRAFVSLPAGIARALLVAFAIAALLLAWRGGKPGRWRAFALAPLALTFDAAAVFAAAFAFTTFRPGVEFWMAHPEASRAWAVLLPMLGLVLALWFLRPARAAQAGAAAMFWLGALGVALTFITPGVSILFLLPLGAYALFGVLGLFWRPGARIGALIAGVMMLLIWAPLFNLVELALGYSMPLANGLSAGLALLPFVGALAALQAESGWRAPMLAVSTCSIAALAWAGSAPSYSAARPQSLNLTHVSNAASGETYVSAGSVRRALPQPLAAAAFGQARATPGDRGDSWILPTPPEDIARPALEQAHFDPDAHTLRATLRTNGAYRVTLRLPRAAAPIVARVRGEEVLFDDAGAGSAYINLACQGRSCDGAPLEIQFAPEGRDAAAYLLGHYPMTTTQASRALIAERGAAATPFQFGDSVLTIDAMPLRAN